MTFDTQIPSRNLEERKELRPHVFNIKRQGGWLIACLFIGGALISLDPLILKILGIVVVVVVGPVGATKYQDGLGYRKLVHIFNSLRFRAKTKGVTNIEELSETDKAPIAASIMSYPAVDDEGVHFRIGTVYNPKDDCDTFIVTGDGLKHFGADPLELMQQEDLWIDGIAEVLSNYDGRVGVAFPYISRPGNTLRQELWDGLNIDPDVLAAQPFDSEDENAYANATVEERQATSLKQSQDFAAVYEAEVIRAVALTVPRPSNWPKVKDGQLGVKLLQTQLEEAPVVVLALMLESELRSRGIENAAILDRVDISRYVRASWDMVSYRDWSIWLEGIDPVNHPEVIADGLNEWPAHNIAIGKSRRRYYTKTDNTYHRCLQMKGLTTPLAGVGEFDEVFDVNYLGFPRDVGIAFTLYGDSVNPRIERSILKRRATFEAAIVGSRKGEYNEMDEDIERAGQTRRKDSELYRSKSIALSYGVFIVISATSLEMLDKATDALIRRAKRNHIILRTIKWETRQILALFTALLGVSMFN